MAVDDPSMPLFLTCQPVETVDLYSVKQMEQEASARGIEMVILLHEYSVPVISLASVNFEVVRRRGC